MHNGWLWRSVLEMGWRAPGGRHLALVLHHDDLWCMSVLLVVSMGHRRVGVVVGVCKLLATLHRRLRRIAEGWCEAQLLRVHRLRRGWRVRAGLQ